MTMPCASRQQSNNFNPGGALSAGAIGKILYVQNDRVINFNGGRFARCLALAIAGPPEQPTVSAGAGVTKPDLT